MESKSNMSLQALKMSENGSSIDFFPTKEGTAHTLFFVCGSKRGFVSDKAAETLRESGAAAINELQYSEVQLTSGEWAPCISTKGKPAFSL
jgi:hypothetical protein